MRGLFITVEGIEGSGKTTVAEAIADNLSRKGLTVMVTAEPGATLVGSHIRQLLATVNERTAWTETFLFLADRAEHVAKVIKPALERGEVVLCDRFTDSTIAYQGFGLGLPLEWLTQLNSVATNGLVPNLTLLLDIEPEAGLKRSRQETVFERRSLDFHQRVRYGYLWLAKQEPHRVKVIDASQPFESVLAQALRLVEEALAKWR
jgi:dTMP kinase